MTKVLVDTDVVSFVFKRDSRAELYRPHLEGKISVISFVTVAELDQWALRHNWGKARRVKLEMYIETFIVCSFERELCQKWAEVRVHGQKKGYSVPYADAWVAASALLYKLPLITHNKRHYENIDGLIVMSEG